MRSSHQRTAGLNGTVNNNYKAENIEGTISELIPELLGHLIALGEIASKISCVLGSNGYNNMELEEFIHRLSRKR